MCADSQLLHLNGQFVGQVNGAKHYFRNGLETDRGATGPASRTGTDSFRAMKIILLMSIFLLPTLYVWVARKDDVLPAADTAEELEQD